MRMPTTAAGPRPGAFWARWSRLGLSAARRHWLLTLLLLVGLVLRILTQIAYRPALFYIDTIKYLYGAYQGADPPGYNFFLKSFLTVGNLDMVAGLQHLLGLGMAVAIYLLLLRRGAPRWLAALATAPVLLDGYQLQMEQTVMPDVLFEVLLVAGLVVLLWRDKPGLWALGVAGFLLGCTAPMWEPGEILLVPVVVYAVFAARDWQVRLGHAVLIAVAFVIPILAVSYHNKLTEHHFSLAPQAGSTIYGRAAYAADCSTLKLPAYERPLCVPHSEALKWGPDNLDHASYSPLKHLALPPGMTEHTVATNFAERVFEQQPFLVIKSVLGDAFKLFEVHRVTSAGDTSISRWQFQDSYPQFPPYITVKNGLLQFSYLNRYQQPVLLGDGLKYGGGPPQVITPIARFLRHYQLDGGYTPGPLLLFTLITGLIGSAFLFARRKYLTDRDWEAVRTCACILAAGVLVLLLSDTFEFSWRYQLPALITLPPAGALGISVIIGFFRHRSQGRPSSAQPVTSAGPAQDSPAPSEVSSADQDVTGAALADDGPATDGAAAATPETAAATPSPAPVPDSAADEGMTPSEQQTGR
jgi:hypothetical protein